MHIFRSTALVVLPLLLLAGCGKGWETRSYDGTPYAGERTAGQGVQYVRAMMMQEKGPVLEPELPKKEEAKKDAMAPSKTMSEVKEETKIKDAEPMFEKKQQK